MRKKINLCKELSEFTEHTKKEYPNLKEQFDLYLDKKKKYDASKSTIVGGKEHKAKISYGVKYK